MRWAPSYRIGAAIPFLLAGVLVLLATPAAASAQTTERIPATLGPYSMYLRPSISADGRFVAFASNASDLVPGDTNGADDVFVHDRQTGTTERVSVDTAGNQGNSHSGRIGGGLGAVSLSADGRIVAFVSTATNLTPEGQRGIFVHDRGTRVTEWVIATYTSRLSLSADGRFVAFDSSAPDLVAGDTNNNPDVFVHDRHTRTTERVSVDSAGTQGIGESLGALLSADGRLVAFVSSANNLVPGDTGWMDVFVHDRQTRATERVSVDNAGTQGNGYSSYADISADGRFVAFLSWASNLAPGDTNRAGDVFVHDRGAPAAVTTTVSFDSPAPPGGPGPLNAVFAGIDFGIGQWAWSGPYDVDPTNNVYFANSTGTSRTFAFSQAPRVLQTLRVYGTSAGTMTLADDAGQTLSQDVVTGLMQLVTTGWTRPSTTVTVSFTMGWSLGVDDLTSTAP